jgi:hypothetical protein
MRDKGIWVSLKLKDFGSKRFKIAVSLRELVEGTNDFSVKNQGGCVPKLIESNPKEMYLRYNVKCALKTSDPKGHDVRVRFDYEAVKEGTKWDKLDVKVSCSCPAHLFWGAQHNLHQRDALEGQPRPLLQAPTERLDLRSNFLICKHAKVVLDRIVPSVQRVINDISRKKEVEKNKALEESKDKVVEDQKPQPKDSPLPYKPLFQIEKERKREEKVEERIKEKQNPKKKKKPEVEAPWAKKWTPPWQRPAEEDKKEEPKKEEPKKVKEAPEEIPEETSADDLYPADKDVPERVQKPNWDEIPEETPADELYPAPPEENRDEERRLKEEETRKRKNRQRKVKPGEGTPEKPPKRFNPDAKVKKRPTPITPED